MYVCFRQGGKYYPARDLEAQSKEIVIARLKGKQFITPLVPINLVMD